MAAATQGPHARAHLSPPPGREYTGTFYFPDDIYNYLGYAQQAEDGALLFRSKLALEPHRPALVNLEWWAVGRLSALLGRRPLLAWRLLGLASALALVLLADVSLRRAGLGGAHRLPALVLVLLGGGFGGVMERLRWPAGAQPLDLSTGLFPFVELIANPHFVAGTCLLLGALLALAAGGRRGTVIGVALAALAGLARPYDLALIVVVRALAVCATEAPRRWPALLLPLAGVAPVVLYDAWVFAVHPAFSVFSSHVYGLPPLRWLLAAVAPALALALLSLRRPAATEPERRWRAHLWAWIAACALIVALRPATYSLQFLVGIGLPLLSLAAVFLARYPAWITAAAAAVLSSSAVVAVQTALAGHPRWLVEPVRVAAARALRPLCRPGDVALAPRDVGLFALAHAPCSPWVSHPVQDGFTARDAAMRAFYLEWDAARRGEFLQREGVAALVLPGDGGPRAAGWLGEGSPFVQKALVTAPGGTFSVYGREEGRR